MAKKKIEEQFQEDIISQTLLSRDIDWVKALQNHLPNFTFGENLLVENIVDKFVSDYLDEYKAQNKPPQFGEKKI